MKLLVLGATARIRFAKPGSASPWLPQPKEWRELTVAAESGSPDSMLTLYQQALRLRRSEAALGDGGMRWLELGSGGVLAFARDPGSDHRDVEFIHSVTR